MKVGNGEKRLMRRKTRDLKADGQSLTDPGCLIGHEVANLSRAEAETYTRWVDTRVDDDVDGNVVHQCRSKVAQVEPRVYARRINSQV